MGTAHWATRCRHWLKWVRVRDPTPTPAEWYNNRRHPTTTNNRSSSNSSSNITEEHIRMNRHSVAGSNRKPITKRSIRWEMDTTPPSFIRKLRRNSIRNRLTTSLTWNNNTPEVPNVHYSIHYFIHLLLIIGLASFERVFVVVILPGFVGNVPAASSSGYFYNYTSRTDSTAWM